MRAIVLRAVGGPENLILEELPTPVPGPGEVLVRTEAIGVTFTEAAMRTGALPLPVELPAPFGFEAAGVVTEAGEGADAGLLGQRVVLMHTGLGSYAEYIAVPESAVTVIPEGLGAAEAVAVANYGAVAFRLVEKANLTGEETVLVEVAGSGVGGYVTQLARRRGVKAIIGTAGTAAKREHAASLGADEVLDHTEPGWTGRLTNVDIAFHSLGGDTTTALLDGMTPGTGRILLYGFLRGAPVVTAMDLLYRGADPDRVRRRGLVQPGAGRAHRGDADGGRRGDQAPDRQRAAAGRRRRRPRTLRPAPPHGQDRPHPLRRESTDRLIQVQPPGRSGAGPLGPMLGTWQLSR